MSITDLDPAEFSPYAKREPSEAQAQLCRQGEHAQKLEAIRKFNELRLKATDLLLEAAKLWHLPYLYREQASAAAKIAGAQLHRIKGQADAADYECIAKDLEHVARSTDRLIGAMGDEAASWSRHVERDLFSDVTFRAVEGEALFNLREAGERVMEEYAAVAAE